MKNSYPSLYTFVALLFLLLVSGGSDVIEESCGKIAKGETEEYEFCVDSLKSNPRSKSATSTWSLIPIGIRIARSNATAVGQIISELLQNKSLDSFSRLCLEDCSELYSETDLPWAFQAFRCRDYDTVKMVLSAATTAATTCEDGFKEREGSVSPLTKENQYFSRLAEIPLAFTNTIPSHANNV